MEAPFLGFEKPSYCNKDHFHCHSPQTLHFLGPFLSCSGLSTIHGLSFPLPGQAPWKSPESHHGLGEMVRSSISSSKFSLWEGWEHLTFIKEIISSPSRSADIRYLGSWVRKIPWRREWQPTPVFLPEEFHGQRSLVGYSPRCCKESDMTE